MLGKVRLGHTPPWGRFPKFRRFHENWISRKSYFLDWCDFIMRMDWMTSYKRKFLFEKRRWYSLIRRPNDEEHRKKIPNFLLGWGIRTLYLLCTFYQVKVLMIWILIIINECPSVFCSPISQDPYHQFWWNLPCGSGMSWGRSRYHWQV